jgi:hypothetical protein
MKEIISSETGSVSSTDCINHSADIPKLSKTDAQKTLDKFFAAQWLKEVFILYPQCYFYFLNYIFICTERGRSIIYS